MSRSVALWSDGLSARRGAGLRARHSRKGATWRAFLFAVALAAPLAAHDGVHEQIERATRRIAAEPKNAALYLHRAELYRLHHDWDRARADYTRAAKLDPRMEIVDFARGRMELEAGRPAIARTSLDRFLGGNPGHGEARLTRARTLVQLKKAAEAIADYDAAIAHTAQPTPDLYHERAKVLAELGRIDDAVRGLDEGMTRLGTLVSLQRFAIDLLLSAGRHDDALARAETLPDNRETRALLARIEGAFATRNSQPATPPPPNTH